MNLTEKYPFRKDSIRLRPNHDEGLNIQYHLKRKRHSFVCIGERLGVSHQIVVNVVSGRRRSARIEAEIARILGKADWNEVVLEARSEIQKKPAKVILYEMRRAREGRLRAVKESMGDYITQEKARIAAKEKQEHAERRRA